MLQLKIEKLKELKRKTTKYQAAKNKWHQHIDLLEKNLSTIYDDGYGDLASDNDDYARTYINMTMVIMMIMQGQTLNRWWW